MEHFNLGEIQPKQDKFVLIIHTGRRGGEEERRRGAPGYWNISQQTVRAGHRTEVNLYSYSSASLQTVSRPDSYSIIFANCYNYRSLAPGHNILNLNKILKNTNRELGRGQTGGSFYKINVKL